MRVLIVESQVDLRDAIALALRAEGMSVETIESGDEVAGMTADFDVLLVGRPEADMDGCALVARLRLGKHAIPTILLAPDIGVEVRLAAFRAGADDVLVEGYSRAELAARIKALVRRSQGHASPTLSAGPLSLDLHARAVRVEGRFVHLTGREYQIVEALMVRKGATLSKGALMDRLYCGMADEPDMKIVDVFVCKVRKKLAQVSPAAAAVLTTVWGRGYRIADPAPDAAAAA